ncbi:MAG: AAA family ATPase, partial [Cyclobacteriaceae bacterium]
MAVAYDQRPPTSIDQTSSELAEKIRDMDYVVLVGRNNTGKSFLLRALAANWGENSSYLGPQRYNNFNTLNAYSYQANRKRERYNQYLNRFQNEQQNFDNSPINLQTAIAQLTDVKREFLFEIMKELLGTDMKILDTVQNNSMSQKYISCDGHNLSFTSSGFRLMATIVTCLLDDDYDSYLIDEPELGISPEAQGLLADILFDRQRRKKYFPHIKTIVFATHSTVFLDRNVISNNFKVTKNGNEIKLHQVKTQQDFNKVHFFLLGNRFETLYLPSLIILVEGKTDHEFIERVFSLKFPSVRASIIHANSDNRIKEVLNVAKGLLGDLQRSPYRDRIFVVLDSTHTPSLPAQLQSMGVPNLSIVVWSKNGIEYFYPPSIMDKIYGLGRSEEH